MSLISSLIGLRRIPEDVRPASAVDPIPTAAQAKQFSATPSSADILSAEGTVFTLAAGEKGVIVNLGTNPLFVRYAASASITAFHLILPGGGANDDGTGGSVEIDDHVGAVSVAGTSPRYLAYKRS